MRWRITSVDSILTANWSQLRGSAASADCASQARESAFPCLMSFCTGAGSSGFNAAPKPLPDLGCLIICLWLDGEGGSFYRQPASMPFLQQKFANFLKRSQIFLQDSAKYNEFWQSFAFCRNSGKILWKSRRKWRIWMKIQQNFAKITKKSQKLMVRKTANLSLERCKGMQIL